MAIVFKATIEKQKVFFWGITLMSIAFLVAISLIVFYPIFFNQNQATPGHLPPTTPNVIINLGIMDSDQVRNLEPFPRMEKQFVYFIEDQRGKQIQGNISAIDQDEAEKLLQEANLKVLDLKEMSSGRSNPFIPY